MTEPKWPNDAGAVAWVCGDAGKPEVAVRILDDTDPARRFLFALHPEQVAEFTHRLRDLASEMEFELAHRIKREEGITK